MSDHFALLTVNWATRQLDYEGLTGNPDDDLSFDECLARIEEHERGPDGDVIKMWAIAFTDADTVVRCGEVLPMKQMEFYSAAELRGVFPLSDEEPDSAQDVARTSDRRCPTV